MATEETRVASAASDFAMSSTEVAVIVTLGGLGTTRGGVYRPPEVMVPQVEPEQPAPETLQDTVESIAF